MLALDEQSFSRHVAPHFVAAIDSNEVGDISTKYEIHLVSRILDAHIDARSGKQQPHDAILGGACGHAREFEADDDATIRKGGSVGPLAKTPQEKRRIEIVGFDAIACVCRSPSTELAYKRAKRIARRREPISRTCFVGGDSTLDNPLLLHFTQPRNKHRARYQRYAAVNVVER